MKFKDLVVNLVSGAMPTHRAKYYIKRFAQENSVRRLATVLIIGLFIFQSVVVIFPPRATKAASGNDLIYGGIGEGSEASMKQNMVNYLNKDSYGSAFFQLMGINQQYVQNNMKRGSISTNGWKYSMGHNAFGGPGCSVRFDQIPEFRGVSPFPGSESVYVGSPSCRWNQTSFVGLIGDKPVYVGGTWWNIGIIGDCGNIVLIPVAPPELPNCESVNLSSNSVLVGQPVVLTGVASAKSTTKIKSVNMNYNLYKSNASEPTKNPPIDSRVSSGISFNGSKYIDNSGKSFTFSSPGSYTVRLAVTSSEEPAFKFGLPGSLVNSCAKTINVVEANKQIVCSQLGIDNQQSTGFTSPFTPKLSGLAKTTGSQGTAYPSKFEYILLSEVPASTAGTKVNYNGKTYKEDNPSGGKTRIIKPVTYSNNNAPQFLDPTSGGSFEAEDFTQQLQNGSKAQNYLIILRVYNQSGQLSPDNVEGCYKSFTVSPEPIPEKIVCKSLRVDLNPEAANIPNNPTFVGTSEKQGQGPLTPSKYEYNIYKKNNGKYEKLSNMPITENSTAYENTKQKAYNFTQDGEYKVTLSIISSNGSSTEEGKDSQNRSDCEKTFVLSPNPPKCVSLTSVPSSIQSPPKDVELTGITEVDGGEMISATFDFGDGSKPQKLNTKQLINKVKHEYTAPGRYEAKLTFESTTGSVQSAPEQCKTIITVTDQKFIKLVANLTQQTSDGKPTDANGKTAKAGDVLRYQIGICNASPETIKSFVFEDNITDLLYYTDVIDSGGGEIITTTGANVLTWKPQDIPPLPQSKACVDENNRPIYENYSQFKEFKVKVKSPIPNTPLKPADPNGFDCEVTDEFRGNTVSTPVACSTIKLIESRNPLPRTGSGWALGVIGFFAAASTFLFFRNRMLKKELELVEKITEEEYGKS
jgi:hypothetical protein